MRVILLQDILNLGVKGEIKEVARGYARNFLLPRKMALIATAEELKKIKLEKEREAFRQDKEFKKAQKLGKILTDFEIIIKPQVTKEGKLYGSVTAKEIAKAIKKEKGVKIAPYEIILTEPIKKLGKYSVEIRLGNEERAKIGVIVEKP